MKNLSVAALLLLFCPACPHSEASTPATVSTAPPTTDCEYIGSASASGTEPSPLIANRTARERLASRAEQLGGNYVELTAQDSQSVDFQLEASMVRLEGRMYKCPPGDDDSGTSSASLGGAGQPGNDAGAGLDRSELSCPAPSEARPLDASEGPGWQCARKTAAGWVADGPYVARWDSGATKTEGSFENGKRSGAWLSYFANGQLRERATFRDGQLAGCAQEFDADGHPLPALCAGADAVDRSDGG